MVISSYCNASSKNYGCNAIVIYDTNRTLWFSYETLVAFSDKNGNRYVRQNDWGTTTGKHLNLIDGGDKESRLSFEDFKKAYKKCFRKEFKENGFPTIKL